ncbi:hypothetical protein PV371_36885 [Streptomyces sp. TX20-6-3]|uniref:hypothetical protein n=1 Tax=Streptomyces sp. TX20-6-3 TaxID=3028705 RepID=UPI0029BCE572|nr:hypothetical protein [Streptomyces sp. TX20-6-3]MDX2565195.1 hypothetical protein [Streptomyces sp. TX20-6-3]
MSSGEVYGLCLGFLRVCQEGDLSLLRQVFAPDEELTVLAPHQGLGSAGGNAFGTAAAHQFSAVKDTGMQITAFCADGTAACAAAGYGSHSEQDVHVPQLHLAMALGRGHSGRIVLARWSVPADACLRNPGPTAPQPGTSASAPGSHASGAVPALEDKQFAPGTHGILPSGAAAAFAVYQQLAATVTSRLNQGTFDFAADVAPHTHEQFIEIADAVPLDLARVQESFAPIIDAIASGASFSWAVRLEYARDLTPDITLLITNSRVSLTPSEGKPDTKQYRITNLLTRNASGSWVFLHQHRTEIPAG